MPVDVEDIQTVSPLILAEVISLFGDRPDPHSGARIRFPVRDCPAKAYPGGETGDAVGIDIVDLGFSGVGFVSDRPFVVGQPVLIDFRHAGLPPQRWTCTVVRSAPQEDGRYRIGASFCFASQQQTAASQADE